MVRTTAYQRARLSGSRRVDLAAWMIDDPTHAHLLRREAKALGIA